MEINIKEAYDFIKQVFNAGKVPMLHSSPGLGKSAIFKQIAKEYNLKLIDKRLTDSDPTDFNGFPSVQDGKGRYIPFDEFPTEGDPLPLDSNGEEMNGWLVLLDEFNAGLPATQAAAYKLLLDKKVGNHNLHPDVYVGAAGNLATDNAHVNPINTANQSRMIHAKIKINAKMWLDWAYKSKISPMITSFIEHKVQNLYNFSPEHHDMTFPCPRTWEFASDIITCNAWKDLSITHTAILSGTIGEGMAREFIGYCQIREQLPTEDDILNAPDKVIIPREPSAIFFFTSILSSMSTVDNFDKVIQVIDKLPMEFQVITIKSARSTEPLIATHQNYIQWLNKNAIQLM